MSLIFLDIDGTLAPPGTNSPPQSASKAICAARESGHKVFLCTGRNVGMSRLLMDGLDGTVSSAGAYVLCGDEVLCDCPMTSAQRDRVLAVMDRAGVHCTLETKECAYSAPETMKAINSLSGSSEMERWKKAAFRPIEEYNGDAVYTVPFVCREAGQIETARRELEDEFFICIYDFFPGENVNGELFLKGCDKGTGIRLICGHLGVPLTDTIGFGDSMNDYAMMQTVGTSVCMGNGSDELKAISTMACPSVDEDGLAAGFEMLGLV